jgi:small subunit ribosomal protein S17
VHDQNNEYHVGDAVDVEECRPISKDKHFRIISATKSAEKNK